MNELPVIDDCQGCGVCCFHMGYPTFMMPAEPLSEEQILADPVLRRRAADPDIRQHLLEGHPGEVYWHRLPQHLRQELGHFLEQYDQPEGELDGPCIWLDLESRRCIHHAYRPRVCRDFQTGSAECQRWRVYYQDQILPNDSSSQEATGDP